MRNYKRKFEQVAYEMGQASYVPGGCSWAIKCPFTEDTVRWAAFWAGWWDMNEAWKASQGN
jgi:hypothetical protein